MTRRDAIKGILAGTALWVGGCARKAGGAGGPPEKAQPPPAVGPGPFKLPALPYPANGLEPHISRRTMGFHHGKHHAGYVRKLNLAVKGTPFASQPLEAVINATAGKPDQKGLFNNAAQIWNHTFYWKSMKPGGGGKPSGQLAARIKADFGGYEPFVRTFTKAAATRFGSGWAWLVNDGGKLSVMNTANADTPITQGKTPLLTIDVWEHAYYLDFQNRRKAYIKAFLDHLVNWEFASSRLAGG